MLVDHLTHRPEDFGILRRLEDRKGGSINVRQDVEVDPTPEQAFKRDVVYYASRCYQHFKGAFVAGLDQNSSWRIDSDGITEILTRMANHGIPNRFDREDPL